MQHLFAMFDPGRDLTRLCKIDGVDDVVRRDGRLVRIAGDVVAAIRRAERDGLFDAAAGCRPANGDAQPPDARLAGLVTKLKTARRSKARTQLLMSLLVSR